MSRSSLFTVLLCIVRRSQWPRGLRRRSMAARLLRSWVRSSPEARMFVCCVCCCVVSATNWSLVHTSPTDCGASLCVIKKSRERWGHSPRWAAELEKIIIIIIIIIYCSWMLVFYCLLLLYNQSITALSVQLMQFNLKSYTIQYMSCTAISQLIFFHHLFTYLWNGIYENLVVKPVFFFT
jgi:hypothetical protein